jgi:hypothetical protein
MWKSRDAAEYAAEVREEGYILEDITLLSHSQCHSQILPYLQIHF